ncbi:MAG: DUF2510 domain-containing protein [Myxococcota bacterium]
MTELTAPVEALYEESLAARRRDWRWLPVIVVIMLVAVLPVLVPFAVAAWLYNVLRFRKTRVRVEPDHLWVGKRFVRLCALEASTIGQAGNTWPWRHLNRRYLGANPIWTADSVGVRGLDAGKRYWVAVGTNDREQLVNALMEAIPAARARAEAAGTWAATVGSLPRANWYPDPWDPIGQLRWWDGTQWTGRASPKPTTISPHGPPPAAPGSDKP